VGIKGLMLLLSAIVITFSLTIHHSLGL